MYIKAALFLLALGFATGSPARTKYEWISEIEQYCLDINELYNAKNFTAFREYFTGDYQGFHPGALEAMGFDGIDLSRHYIKLKLLNVRWTAENFAVAEVEIHQESSEGVKQLEHALIVIVEDKGRLKSAAAMWNFV